MRVDPFQSVPPGLGFEYRIDWRTDHSIIGVVYMPREKFTPPKESLRSLLNAPAPPRVNSRDLTSGPHVPVEVVVVWARPVAARASSARVTVRMDFMVMFGFEI